MSSIDREDTIEILKDLQKDHLQFCLIPFRQAIERVQALPPADTDISEYSDKLWKNAYERGKEEEHRWWSEHCAKCTDADRPQGWIPCSEMLPRARESVLIAVNHKYGDWVGEGCYWETTDNHIIWKGYRWNATYWDDEIIAWMPLPQPWKGADDE